MSPILSYPGVYWSARVLAIVAMVGGTWLMMLMLARFFRPKHVIALIKADPPKVEEIGGEFGGIKGRIRFNAQATALTVLENRIEAGEAAVGRLWIVAEEHSRALAELKTESGNASE